MADLKNSDKRFLFAVLAVPSLMLVYGLVRAMPWTPDWVAAYGGWLSGIGSFAAAGTALWVSTQEQRNKEREQKIDLDKKRHVILTRIQIYTLKIRTHVQGVLRHERDGRLRIIFEQGNYEGLYEVLFGQIRLNPRDPFNELPLIDEISAPIIMFEEELSGYFDCLDHIRKNKGKPPLFWYNSAVARAASIEIKATRLNEAAVSLIKTLRTS
ncbi:hypothetical protein D3273_02075 [Lichenibacterium minor]|uniref:Uncharacterized protein n=1 Tax=Lichenibacterium minor TaxID=2316528 RepID=A0A4Q2UBN9_9HYPH|nr:hypothetical protein [Lichenibacterium minor]RYC34060.1 hypothetical protein D3273_02075 [Lichenibacterium minor]